MVSCGTVSQISPSFPKLLMVKVFITATEMKVAHPPEPMNLKNKAHELDSDIQILASNSSIRVMRGDTP